MTISHGERAGNHDTTEDSFVAEGYVPAPSAEPEEQLRRLRDFLVTFYPTELHRTNVQEQEAVADTAIRLMMSQMAGPHPMERQWCTGVPGAPCNKPLDHRDQHGIIVGHRNGYIGR